MNARIDKDGWLWIERAGTMTQQFCPKAEAKPARCGEWCPLMIDGRAQGAAALACGGLPVELCVTEDDRETGRVRTLAQLRGLVRDQKSVICPHSPGFKKPKPAAFVLNLIGSQLVAKIQAGMYVYAKKEKGK